MTSDPYKALMANPVISWEQFEQLELYLRKECAYQSKFFKLPASTRTSRLRKKRRAMIERWYCREQPALDRPADAYHISPSLRNHALPTQLEVNSEPFPPATRRDDDGNLRLF